MEPSGDADEYIAYNFISDLIKKNKDEFIAQSRNESSLSNAQ